MDSFHHLNHLTKPRIKVLPELQAQPPAIDTRVVVKSRVNASVKASDGQVQTITWFQSAPLTAQTIRMIRGIKLFAESHDQGYVSDSMRGNWTWFQLAILDNAQATSPKRKRDGQELVVMSHSNKVRSKTYHWLPGETFNASHDFLKSLEAGNVIAVRLCACFPNWEIFAKNGHLVMDIGDDNGPVPINPIPIDTDSPIPPRRKVETWYEEARTSRKIALELSLFIRAMKTFQGLPPNDQLSYYRVAGIHGSPYNVSWNMGKKPVPLKAAELGRDGFYCQHNNFLFPTWHRAYMALFERRVSDLMMEEAMRRAKQTGEWVLAAKRWRLPYWDWAVNPELPDLVSSETISIISVWNGQDQPQMEDFANPMYRFQMPDRRPMGDEGYGDYRINNKDENVPWDLCVGTSRHGITLSDPERRWVWGVSNNSEVNSAIAGQHHELLNLTLKDAVFRLLTHDYATKYVHFASTKHDPKSLKDAPGDTAKGFLNLEQIHNSVHNYIGGTTDVSGLGHMSSPAVAAFDPVFLLHHCNIDRLLHLWQCSNPGNWFHQKPEHSVDDSPRTDLVPFHHSSNGFYNSNSIIDGFGDMIPEKSHEYINKLYGPPDKAYEHSVEELDPVINVVYNRYAFEGRQYALLFFLGEIDRSMPYHRQDTLVGSIFTFSTPTAKDGVVPCQNCYAQQCKKVLSHAQIPLTRVVAHDKRRSRQDAMNYFKKSLKWIATYQGGEVVNREHLTDLKPTLFIGVNQLQKNIGKKSLFEFDKYERQDFDWGSAYVGN